MNEIPRGMVHYVLRNGECRPFLITRVWNKENMVNGTLFIDGSNDYNEVSQWIAPLWNEPIQLTVWRTTVHFSGENVPNTWHYPETA